MRLWQKDLIEVLPRQQLVAQWREASLAAGNILQKGTPNHILINKIMDYSLDHFISYSIMVRGEMTQRGYRTMDRVMDKIISVKKDFMLIPFSELYSGWMNEDYFRICYYNLKEKWMCGGIKDNEWEKIENKRKELKIECP